MDRTNYVGESGKPDVWLTLSAWFWLIYLVAVMAGAVLFVFDH
jgi:hypothetical protein